MLHAFRRPLNDATPVEKADVAAGLALGRFRDHPAIEAISKAGDVSDQEPLYAITGFTFTLGLLMRDRRLTEAGGRMLGAVILSAALKTLVKRNVTRTRPNVLMDEGRYETAVGGDEKKPWQSFPSGHPAGATAAARALARIYPDAGWACVAAAAAMGMIRVAKGAHYPLDVAAGALVGLAAEAVVDGGVRGARRLLQNA